MVHKMAQIEVKNLVKIFKVIEKESGIKGAIVSIFHPKRKEVRAVNNISFTIEEGSIVGFIGPNGAGKSTTIKMLTGILTPTSGTVHISGLSPYKERKKVVSNLGVVFGQRSQLNWDLRLSETYEMLKRIYRIDDALYKRNLKKMEEILGIDELYAKPVRQLSLGQRMRGDLAAAMLHSPPILFLDEPTIGLDIDAKNSIRKFIKEINREYKTTIILTTHDLDDISELCSRIIIINKGIIIEDGSLSSLIERIAPNRRLIVDFTNAPENISHPSAVVLYKEGARVCFQFDKTKITAAELIGDLSKTNSLKDISIEEADIEDIISQLYREPVKSFH